MRGPRERFRLLASSGATKSAGRVSLNISSKGVSAIHCSDAGLSSVHVSHNIVARRSDETGVFGYRCAGSNNVE